MKLVVLLVMMVCLAMVMHVDAIDNHIGGGRFGKDVERRGADAKRDGFWKEAEKKDDFRRK